VNKLTDGYRKVRWVKEGVQVRLAPFFLANRFFFQKTQISAKVLEGFCRYISLAGFHLGSMAWAFDFVCCIRDKRLYLWLAAKLALNR